MKHKKILLPVLLFSLCISCASTPELGFFVMGPDYGDGKLTYFPPTKWDSTEEVYCFVDINHRSVPDMPVLCAFSIVGKKNMPRGISAVYFQNSRGGTFALTGLEGRLAEPKNKLLRIGGNMAQETFTGMIQSEGLILIITMEGTNYTCVAPKEFEALRQQFLDMYFVNSYIDIPSAKTPGALFEG